MNFHQLYPQKSSHTCRKKYVPMLFWKIIYHTAIPCDVSAHCSTFFTTPHRPLRHLPLCFGLKNVIFGSENWFPVSINWPTDPTESWGKYIETISLHLFAQVKPLNQVAFSTSSFFRFVKNLAAGFTYSVTSGTICSRASSTSTKTQTCRHEVTTNYHFVS